MGTRLCQIRWWTRKWSVPELPWVRWFPSNWLSEPGLSLCDAATRGIWADAINSMMLSNSDHISGSIDQLSRLCRCSPQQMKQAILEMQNFKIAEISDANGHITILCRRLS